ncbi:MAG: hypothetical protein V7638_4643 [Acidobacteriota bacterium]|jgi:hypothetical protein
MNRQFLFALCLGLFCVTFAFEASSVAQTRRRSSKPINNPKIKPPEDAMPDQAADPLAVVNGEIRELCAGLHQTITDANQLYSKPPFDLLTPAADFQSKCYGDGTLVWTAARNGNYDGDPSDTQNTIEVKFKVTDLTLGDLTSRHGVVSFGSKDKKIHVTGPATIATVATNADADVKQWWIDLRDEADLAKKFKESIQDLVEKLATRSKLMAPVA